LSEDLSRLHKILKDNTRTKILEVLEQKAPLTYGELLEQSGITNTGRLNYHLKVLGDLVSKDGQTGKYGLSEKGRLAIDFLGKFRMASMGVSRQQQQVKIPRTPFEGSGKVLQILLGLEIVLVLIINLYAYFTLPSVIPLHYEFNGQILASGPNYIFLLFAGVFNIPQVVFLLLSGMRYSLVDSQFSAINFPSFQSHLPKINYERRGYWVNKYFSPILALGTVVGLIMIILTLGIYESTLSSQFLPPVYVIGTVAVVAAAVIALIVYMHGYLKGLVTDSG